MRKDTAKVLKVLRKTFGEGVALPMSDVAEASSNSISIGIPSLDWGIFGIGGYPRSHFTEVYGADKTGKTTLLLHMIAGAQEEKLVPIVIDAKGAVASDNKRAKRIGVDAENVILLPIITSEDAVTQARRTVELLAEDGTNLAFFWDDMGLVPTLSETTGGKKKDKVLAVATGEKARIMWNFSRVMSATCFRHHIPMVIVNQLISKIGGFTGGFGKGPQQQTSGGGGTRYAARVRLKLSRGEKVKRKVSGITKPTAVGQYVYAQSEANHFFPPFRQQKLYLDYHSGYDPVVSTLINAEQDGFVTKAKGTYRDKAWERGTKGKKPGDWTDREIWVLEERVWPHMDPDFKQSTEEFEDDDEDLEDEEAEEEDFVDLQQV